MRLLGQERSFLFEFTESEVELVIAALAEKSTDGMRDRDARVLADTIRDATKMGIDSDAAVEARIVALGGVPAAELYDTGQLADSIRPPKRGTLSPDVVRNIRKMYKKGARGRGAVTVARKLGLPVHVVIGIVSGKTYAGVK